MELRVSPEQPHRRWPLTGLHLQGELWASHCLAVLMGRIGGRLATPKDSQARQMVKWDKFPRVLSEEQLVANAPSPVGH